MNTILVILQKEWLELRKDRALMLGLLIPPIFMTVLPLVIMAVLSTAPDEDTEDLGIALADPSLAGLSSVELGQAVLGKQFALLFLLLPVIIPSIVAAQSIIGEKTKRTLEPLLATPLETWELLLAKCLAALIPAVGLTWLCSTLYFAALTSVAVSQRVIEAIVSPAWLLVLILCSPLLALIAIAASVAVSARVNDARTAQQLAGVVVIPFLLVFFAQLAGVLVLNVAIALGAAVMLAVIAAAAVWAAVQIFQRDAILTSWK